jgi:hypothetical protein
MLNLATIYILILAVVVIIGMVRYRKLTTPFKVLTISIIVTFILEVIAEFFSIEHKNNSSLSHIESLTNYFFYSLTFFYLFKNRPIKKLVLISIGTMGIFFIINAIFIQSFREKFPTNIFFASNILYIIFSLLLFKQMLKNPLNINIVKQSIFWFNTGILFFSATMFLNLELIGYYADHHWGKGSLYYFWAGSVYTFSILIGFSLLTDNKKTSLQHG